MVKQEMNFGQFQGTSFTVITLNRESNCTCSEKNHSQFHFDTLTWSELLIQTWMGCIGISKETETYCIRGLASHDSPCRARASSWVYMVRRGADEETKRHPGLTGFGQRHGKTCQKQRNEKVGYRKTEAWQRWKIARYLLHWSSGCRFQRKPLETRWRNWKFRCQQQCLAKSGEERTRNLSQSWCSQDEIRMHRWNRRIYEKAFGRNSTQKKSWSPHSREKIHFSKPPQSCVQIHSDA